MKNFLFCFLYLTFFRIKGQQGLLLVLCCRFSNSYFSDAISLISFDKVFFEILLSILGLFVNMLYVPSVLLRPIDRKNSSATAFLLDISTLLSSALNSVPNQTFRTHIITLILTESHLTSTRSNEAEFESRELFSAVFSSKELFVCNNLKNRPFVYVYQMIIVRKTLTVKIDFKNKTAQSLNSVAFFSHHFEMLGL